MRQLLPAVPRPWRRAAKEQKTLSSPSSAGDAGTVVLLLHILQCHQPLTVPSQPGTQTHPRAPKPQWPGATHKTVALPLVVGFRRGFPKAGTGSSGPTQQLPAGIPSGRSLVAGGRGRAEAPAASPPSQAHTARDP